MTDDVADARVGVFAGKEFVDLGDDLLQDDQFGVACSTGAPGFGWWQLYTAGELPVCGVPSVLGQVVEVNAGQVDVVVKVLAGDDRSKMP